VHVVNAITDHLNQILYPTDLGKSLDVVLKTVPTNLQPPLHKEYLKNKNYIDIEKNEVAIEEDRFNQVVNACEWITETINHYPAIEGIYLQSDLSKYPNLKNLHDDLLKQLKDIIQLNSSSHGKVTSLGTSEYTAQLVYHLIYKLFSLITSDEVHRNLSIYKFKDHYCVVIGDIESNPIIIDCTLPYHLFYLFLHKYKNDGSFYNYPNIKPFIGRIDDYLQKLKAAKLADNDWTADDFRQQLNLQEPLPIFDRQKIAKCYPNINNSQPNKGLIDLNLTVQSSHLITHSEPQQGEQPQDGRQ
jgi:hypothetical protein